MGRLCAAWRSEPSPSVEAALPHGTVGNVLTDILLWVSGEVRPGEYGQKSGQTLAGSALAVHSGRIEDASWFLEAFPTLELADGTASRGYIRSTCGTATVVGVLERAKADG